MFNDFDKIIAKFEKDAETLITELKETVKEKKPTEYKRWRAEGRKRYYSVGSIQCIDNVYDIRDDIDDYRYNTGNYFQTREQAEKHKAYQLALQTIKDDTEGFVPDWEDVEQYKWHGYYDHGLNEFNNESSLSFKSQGAIYFKSKEALQASQKEHRKEWLIVLGVDDA